MELARLIEVLSDPRVYPGGARNVVVHQTHISVVFIAESTVYKIKKPVDLGFLDYSTLEKRRHWCEEEVRLNRRLAPRVYQGVVPIARDGGTLRVEGTGPVIEWAVKMERLPEEATLARTVARGGVDAALIKELARRVADFHRTAGRSDEIAQFGRFDRVALNARENFSQSADQVGTSVSRPVFDRLAALTEEWLSRLRRCVEERAAHGVPCDGHGDLRLDHVYLFPEREPPDDVVIIDCIEFNPRYRVSDPVADMAFLVMDLIRHGRRDLARWFCEAYFEATGDDHGRELVRFYVAYRALVRAKVNGMKSRETEVPSGQRSRAQAEARALWLLALGELEQIRRRPCLVLVGGLPGTGKSTMAQALAREAGFSVIRSDEVRKQLATPAGAAAPQTPRAYESGIYTADWTERTYHECLARAQAAVFEGRRVVVDATFRRESHRRLFLDLALEWAVPGLFLLCQADAAIVRTRLENRRHDLSDADWATYLESVGQWEPLGTVTQRMSHPIDSGKSELPLLWALELLCQLEVWE